MQNLFDILKNVSCNKDASALNEPYEEYSPFIFNRYLAAEKDCLFAVSMMNERRNIPQNVQNLFYFHALTKRNRFFKFEKKEKKNDLDIIMKYYKCSYSVAKEYMKILTKEQIEIITQRMDIGGY